MPASLNYSTYPCTAAGFVYARSFVRTNISQEEHAVKMIALLNLVAN
jgi:hypothetical protein